jgi:hypothetical protein
VGRLREKILFLFFLILKNLNTQCFVLDWICEWGSCSVLGISQVDLVRIPHESRSNVDLEQSKQPIE